MICENHWSTDDLVVGLEVGVEELLSGAMPLWGSLAQEGVLD
jgi:hypothetical protein